MQNCGHVCSVSPPIRQPCVGRRNPEEGTPGDTQEARAADSEWYGDGCHLGGAGMAKFAPMLLALAEAEQCDFVMSDSTTCVVGDRGCLVLMHSVVGSPSICFKIRKT